MPRLCGFYPGICLTTEEKARKTLSQGSPMCTSQYEAGRVTLPLAADPAEPGSQHLRGAEQPAVPGNEDHDGGTGPAEVRAMCCVAAGHGVLRGGEWTALWA